MKTIRSVVTWLATTALVACSSGGDSGGTQGSGGRAGAGGAGGLGAAGGSAGMSGSGGSAGVTNVELTLEILRYESQPMVVDVRVTGGTGSPVLRLPADPGARISEWSRTSSDVTYRLRGLAPDTELELEVEDGGATTRQMFKTHPALPGYQESFPVTMNPSGVSTDYRLFDFSVAPDISNPGIFVIEPGGRTRFFIGLPEVTETSGLAFGVKLLPDGRLLFTQQDHLRIIDELGQEQLRIRASDIGLPQFHHDVIQLPNGNLLVLSIETRDVSYPGEGEVFVAGDFLAELDSAGTITWSWSALDNLDPQRKRADFDAKFYQIFHPVTGIQVKDWTHANGVIHDPRDDSLIVSLRHQDWLVKISRDTREVVWKLGEEGDFALTSGRWFFHQHSPELQPDGSLLLYDNGNGNPNLPPAQQFSRPLRIQLDEAAREAEVVWEEQEEQYLAPIAGDVDRLENGNVLILDTALPETPGMVQPAAVRMREVNPTTNEWVWKLETPVGRFAYRCLAVDRLPGESE